MQEEAQRGPEARQDDGDASQSELFHENSKQRRHDLSFGQRVAAVNADPALQRLVARAFKVYQGGPAVQLPTIPATDAPSFTSTVLGRRSVRDFSGDPLSIEQAAQLLHLGNGITGELETAHASVVQPLRAAPSPGALYPTELYLAAFAVQGLEPGIYHYRVDVHGLEPLNPGDCRARLAEATSYPSIFTGASCAIVLTTMFDRVRFKYGERGYRFALLEAGHIAQNILLAATELELASVPIGGFVDDEVDALLDLDGVSEATLYVIPVGHPAPPADARLGREELTVQSALRLLWSEELDEGRPTPTD